MGSPPEPNAVFQKFIVPGPLSIPQAPRIEGSQTHFSSLPKCIAPGHLSSPRALNLREAKCNFSASQNAWCQVLDPSPTALNLRDPQTQSPNDFARPCRNHFGDPPTPSLIKSSRKLPDPQPQMEWKVLRPQNRKSRRFFRPCKNHSGGPQPQTL